MSQLSDLKDAKNLNDLAVLLGYKPQALAYILYKIPPEEKYTEFSIPKKSGDFRNISAPTAKLKRLQRCLADLLYDCENEIKPKLEKVNTIRGKAPKRERAKKSISHGFLKGLSIATNAERHLKKRFVFNLDIKNFFPSFNFGRVRGFFIKNFKFELKPKVATIIAQIACHNNELPQGSPCSPIISNLIAHILDVELVRLARSNNCVYTRYADDLTFSTNQKLFPKQIACEKGLIRSEWVAGRKLSECIKRSGFEINPRKTHMQFYDSRQVVTGLVVNKVVNTKSEYYRYARAMCHSLFNNGCFTLPESKMLKPKWKPEISNYFKKWAIYLFRNSTDDVIPETTGVKGSMAQLEGILNHIYHVKNYRNKFADSGYRDSRHDGNIKPKQNPDQNNYPPLNRSNNYAHESHKVSIDGIKNLYSRFLFFKLFHDLREPLIFCEGKTDNLYLKCALNQLLTQYSDLVVKNGSKTDYKIKFFNRTKTTSEMFKMAEGASGMGYIKVAYHRHIKRYKVEGQKYPVIMIVDDDEAGRIALKKKPSPCGPSTSLKYHVTDNLYLLTLPTVGTPDTEMEDYFDPAVLATPLNGKTFNRSNSTLDITKEYGKGYFSRFVVKADQATINFDKFKPLLNEIVDIIKAHPSA